MFKESDFDIVQRINKSPYRKINFKAENYAFFKLGLYGNRALIWQSVEEIDKSGWKGNICIRSKKGISRGQTRFNIPRSELEKVLAEFKEEGIPLDSLIFNQDMPDNNLTIQGEIMRNEQGLLLLYSRVKKPMNLALKEQEAHAKGLTAKCILESELWPNSYDDIMELLDYFSTNPVDPSAVVEFSAYNIGVGNLLGRNAVIWEVRNY